MIPCTGTILDMLDRLRQHLHASGLIPEGSRVLVGYSGGADSTCLLHLLHQLGVDCVAAHLHHGQRVEGDTELKLCEAFADSLGVPFVSAHANVPAIAAELKIGIEEAGREARYDFFERAAGRLECDLIATGHTQDDHIETVLLHLARGSGMAGLAGIPSKRGNIVRPLLPFTRAETKAYSAEFWTHDDPSNFDDDFSRARVRHRVLPELRHINPNVDVAITRLSAIAAEEDAFLDGMAAAALERCEIMLNGELRFLTLDIEAAFNSDHLRHLPVALLRRAVRLATQAIGGRPSFEQTEMAGNGIRDHSQGSVTLEGGKVVAEWTPEKFVVRQLPPNEPFRYPLTVPGETSSDEFGWAFEAEPVQSRKLPIERRSMTVELAGIQGPLFFRTAEPGDTMTPVGFDHKRKLVDLMSDAALTPAARRRLPVVCDLVGPVWAPGVCLDSRATGGERLVRVTFRSLQS